MTDNSNISEQSMNQLQADLAAMTETAKRALADLQNYKRRTEEERAELQIYANMKLLQALFPALDNFARAFANVPEDLKNNEWVKGIEAIETSLMNALKGLGLESIEQTQTPFDANLHEILLEEDGNEGQVIQVFEKGYRFNGKTLRPAKVSIGKTEK
ncbi:nucleotide exchange factor GrpE [Candidatus Peregrinibacteria bacterium]|nr:MAG: nucleotide exchange factor GrpE [Candidatus Peregrinibacteria bacterium]